MRIGTWNIEFYNVRRHKPTVYGVDWLSVRGEDCRPFAKADVLGVLRMISDRLGNVVYNAEVDGVVTEFQVLQSLYRFIGNNRLRIVREMIYNGCVNVYVEDPFCIRFAEDVETLDKAHIREEDDVVTVLEDVYRTTGETIAEILKPHMDLLNAVNDSDLNLILNYGAMGVISPESSPLSDGFLDDDGKKEIQDEYRKKYGLTFGKWAVMITRRPVKYQKIDLPIAQLQLNEKRKVALATILQFLNVPKELHAMFESAKYANRNEAELDMYGNCVAAWAGKMVEIINRCYTRIRVQNKQMGYPAGVEVYCNIVGVPALQEAQRAEKQKAREELQMWQELMVSAPDKADLIRKRIDDLIESL